MMSSLGRVVFVLAVCGLIGGCASTEGNFTPVGNGAPPRPENCHIDVYRLPPDRPYTVVSRISVHVEGAHNLGNTLDEPMPELIRQACQSGAEAVTKLSVKADAHSNSSGYTLTALGIRFAG